MISEFVKAWDKNKDKLEEFIRVNKQSIYCANYEDLVKLVFNFVINPEMTGYGKNFDTDDYTVIDDGDYQGMQLFILHREVYQPWVDDYVYTYVAYGSCSYCDTLQGIPGCDWDELPNEQQVKDYMSLCLHLLQNCKYFVEEEDVNAEN